MKAGDPKTTRGLFYVAVAAIVFAVVEAIPFDRCVRAPAVPREVVHFAAQTTDPSPVQVTNDAFSSPILASHAHGEAGTGAQQSSLHGIEPLNPHMAGMLLDAASAPSSKPDTASHTTPEKGRTTRQVERTPRRTILVSGIVEAGVPEALISVDGKDSRPRRVGEQLGPGIKLLAIEDRKVVIGFEHQWKVIYLGQVTEL